MNDNAFIVAMYILALVFSLVYSCNAHATQGTYWGEYHVGSRHSTPGYTTKVLYKGRDGELHDIGTTQYHKWNENNTGGGIAYEVSNNFEVATGFFKNSYGNRSVYGGVDFHTSRARYYSVGIAVGPITGYKDTPQGNRFMVLPNIVFGNDKLRTKIGYIPGDVSVITLTMGIGF